MEVARQYDVNPKIFILKQWQIHQEKHLHLFLENHNLLLETNRKNKKILEIYLTLEIPQIPILQLSQPKRFLRAQLLQKNRAEMVLQKRLVSETLVWIALRIAHYSCYSQFPNYLLIFRTKTIVPVYVNSFNNNPQLVSATENFQAAYNTMLMSF